MLRRACALLVCLSSLVPTPAIAQTTTEDGIRAVLRGDHRAAVGILRPLAEDAVRPDPVAQFFLAILFHAGEGVKGDWPRACQLFLRASRGPDPFSKQASALAESMQEQFQGAAPELCAAEETWQGGPPPSFVLGPDHRISFADLRVLVTRGDDEQRTSIRLPPGAVFMPIQYTALAVTRPTEVRRHFFQWFAWLPDALANPSSWSLSWTLSEVVDGIWIAETDEEHLAVVSGSTPPSAYDVARLVRLQVNARGEAEFAITGGTSPRTEVIPWPGSR
jgi:hypothetical protein